MLIKGKKIMLFPVETVVRELDYRLILAVMCARPDWQIIVGEHEQLFPASLRLQNGIIVLKNLTGGKRPWKYNRYKSNNLRVIHLDEEGGIYEGDEELWKDRLLRRLNPSELAPDDIACTWGQFQADFYKSLAPTSGENIRATGHPRFDLGAPRYRELFRAESDQLRAKYGDFILINTNLVSNNVMGPDILLKYNDVRPEDTERRNRYIDHYCHEARRESEFIRLVNSLSNTFPDRQIVFRPHPSEDIHLYQKLFHYIPRVTVTREGSLHAWLLASEALIHGGCTTAIEAHLCGTPIINFRPERDSRFEVTLPNLLGRSCNDIPEVLSTLRDIRNNQDINTLEPDAARQLERMILNFAPDADSFALLSGIISGCQDAAPKSVLSGSWPLLVKRRLGYHLGKVFKSLARPDRRTNRKTEKFPPLDEAEIVRKLQIIQKITGVQVDLQFLTPKVFSITRAS